MAKVHVAVGVIINNQQEVCIAKRPEGKHLAGFWEFPGGKVEAGETVFDALKRELHEELDITANASRPLIDVHYDYPDKSVLLDVHVIDDFSGTAIGREQQEITWAPVANLSDYEFPAANGPIVKAICSAYLG